MRAVVITRPGGPDVLEERDVPQPQPARGQIRVRVRATALNHADLLQRVGRYPAPAGWPADIPGLEYAGTVDALGPDTARWKPGDRVMGLVGGGGYAEYVVVHEREALPVPEILSFEEAAAVPEAFITAHDALFTRLDLGPGERLLIHAVGSGVGTAALQLAVAAGASVIGTARTAWKVREATALGLDLAIDTSTQDFAEAVSAHTEGQGVHAILDLVGGDGFDANLRILAKQGRLVIVGVIAGTRTSIDLGLVLRNRLTIVGTALRSRPIEEKIAAARAFEKHAIPLLANGRIRPVLHRVYPIADVRDAHGELEKDGNFGKIVLSWD